MGKVADNEIISVLLTNGCNKADAARRLGIDRKTVYNRFQDGEFVEAYEDAKQARDDFLADLRTTATARALEFLVETLEAPTLSIGDLDGVAWDDKYRAAGLVLRALR